MYSVLKCKMHSRSLAKFFEEYFDEDFKMWYHVMGQRCQKEDSGRLMDFEKAN